MAITTQHKVTVDTWVSEADPNDNHAYGPELQVRSGATNDTKRALLSFGVPFPQGANVISAHLYVYLANVQSGSQTYTCRRLINPWKNARVTWNNIPTATATNDDTTVVSSGAIRDEVDFDITNMMQDVAAGSVFYGVQITVSTDAVHKLYSGNTSVASMKPRLVIVWSKIPHAPTDLRPSGGLATRNDSPTLGWSFEVEQDAFQVQISSDTSNNFVANITHDSGTQVDDRNIYSLETAGVNLPSGNMRYWRIRARNDAGDWSPYSDISSMKYIAPGTLNIINPPNGPVQETTPPVDWTFSGVQTAVDIWLFEAGDHGLWGDSWGDEWGGRDFREVWHYGRHQTFHTIAKIPPGKIRRADGTLYKLRMRVWDDVDSSGSPGTPVYVEEEVLFTFAEDNTVNPVATISAVEVASHLEVTVTRATQPDFWAVKVDDEYYQDRIPGDQPHTTGTTYKFYIYDVRPMRSVTIKIPAIVKDGLRVAKHSGTNPSATLTFAPTGIWLSDPDTQEEIEILGGNASPDLGIGESSTISYPLNRRDPIQVIDAVRGYEGTISGQIKGFSQKERLELFKSYLPKKVFRLVMGDLSIRVQLGPISQLRYAGNPIKRTSPAQTSIALWDVSFDVMQVDDWTFQHRY